MFFFLKILFILNIHNFYNILYLHACYSQVRVIYRTYYGIGKNWTFLYNRVLRLYNIYEFSFEYELGVSRLFTYKHFNCNIHSERTFRKVTKVVARLFTYNHHYNQMTCEDLMHRIFSIA